MATASLPTRPHPTLITSLPSLVKPNFPPPFHIFRNPNPNPNPNPRFFPFSTTLHAFVPSSSWEQEEQRWLREEQRWLREEQRWLREERRWSSEREALLEENSALRRRRDGLEGERLPLAAKERRLVAGDEEKEIAREGVETADEERKTLRMGSEGEEVRGMQV